MSNSGFDDAYDDKEHIRGSILTTTIKDLNLGAAFVIDADATVVAAINSMNEHRTGCVLVEKEGKLAGIFTERDVLRRLIFREGNRNFTVETVMTKNPETLEATATLAFALNKMSVGGFRHIPIVDRAGKALAVLSLRDIADFLVELFPSAVLNLPPTPAMGIPRSTDGG